MASAEEQKILDIKVKYEDAIYGIMRYKEKIEELTASQKALKKQLDDGDISLTEYKAQSEATAAVITQYKDNVRVLKKELQNNVKIEQEQKGSLKQLRAELSNATKAFDELSRTEREGSKGQELKKHINEITEELKGAEYETERFYRNVGNYENAIKNVIGANSQFAQSIMDIAGDTKTISGILQNAQVKVAAFGKALLGLAANPIFLALGGIAGAGVAFKWFYDYNQGLEKATRLTQQLTGTTGDTVISIRNEVQALADNFDLEFNETLQAANTMARAFGISIQEALKLMQDGMVSGANANGEFLDTIREYPRYFQEAGISAEAFVAITTNATKQGIFSDKGVDTIKEANLRIREMTTATAAALDAIGISSKKVQEELQNGSKTTFDIMQEVARKLQELPANSSKVGTAIADIFGGPGEDAGLEYIKTLGDIQLNMNKVKEGTGEVAKAQEAQIESQKELNNHVAALFDLTGGGFETMKAQVITIAQNALTSLIAGVIKCANYFVDLYNNSVVFRGAVSAIGITFKTAWNTIKFVFNAIIDGFKIIGRSAKGFLTILEGLVSFDVDKARQGWNELFSGVGKSIREYIGDAKSFGQSVGDAYLDGLADTFSDKGKLKKIEVPSLTASDGIRTSNTKNGGKSTSASAVSGEGSSGAAGKNTNNAVDDAKLEAERIKAIKTQLEADINKIEATYTQKRMDAKKMYLAGMYEDEESYQADLDTLEKEEISAMLDAYTKAGTIGEEKAREVSEKLLDIMLKAKEQMKQQAAELVATYKDEFEKLEQQNSLQQLNQGIIPDDDNEGKLQRYMQFLQEKMNLTSLNNDELAALQQEYNETAEEQDEEHQKNLLDKLKISQEQAASLAQGFTDALSNAFDAMFEDETVSFKKFMKSILKTTLSAIEKALLAYEAAILAKEISSKSWAGVASAAGLIALITAAFSAAKAAVSSFSQGGYVQGKGTGTSDSVPARLSNGESVMTAQATSMFSPILSAFNQLGGGVPIVVNQSGSQMGEDFLAAAVAKGFAMCPTPRVDVDEIERVIRKKKTIESIGGL